MESRLELLMRLYIKNLYFMKLSPCDYDIAWENQLLYEKMEMCIPQEHYDEINFIVYGITRL